MLKNPQRLYIVLAIISWLILLANDLLSIYTLDHQTNILVPDFLVNVFLCFFFLFVFLSFKIYISKKRSSNLSEYLWQVFIIGALTIVVSFVMKFFMFFTNNNKITDNLLIINLLYHLNIGLITVFVANGFYVWKKMILYQKNKLTHVAWHIFEYVVLASILTNFFYFDLKDHVFYVITSPLTFLGFLLTFNLKWVAFLNFKQKLNSLLLILLVAFITLSFLQQVFEQHESSMLIVDLADNIFILAIFCFITLNCVVSFLVLLFNLPTSSVFEQKFGEVMIFQKLHQSIQVGDKEEEVYDILIDSSMSNVLADAGWLEIVDNKGNYKAFINREVDEIDIFELKKVLRKNQINITQEPQYIKNIKDYEHIERLKDIPYKSLLLIPLTSRNQHLGTLVLLKNINDGFDKEMVDIIFTFVSQASIAIKNFRLMTEAIEHERYKEELKIAKEVQRSLFPASLMLNSNIDISAFSKAADEVGGDYYDIFCVAENRVDIVIGDVSGKGTSAAFNMAQMKGIFQSLIQMNIPTDEFMVYANTALGICLEKKSFITLSLFAINTDTKNIEFSRAGHCPPLLYSHKTKNASYLHSKGLGLGIIRNGDYKKHISKECITYQSGDLILLYTDGIIEATNKNGEEYGFDRLATLLEKNAELSSKDINNQIINSLNQFTESEEINDDYTFLILKFV